MEPRTLAEAARETPTATWEELVAFRRKASELGYRSVATAALLSWEWLQREERVFGAFEISHYRPKKRSNSVKVVHPKNGEEAWRPLFDDAGETLFPELMNSTRSSREGQRASCFGVTVKIAGEARHATTRSAVPASRHRPSRQLPTYAKRTRKQLISGSKKRREERTKAAGLPE